MPKITVTITLKPTLLDAQGRTIQSALHQLGFDAVENVRVGKVIEMTLPDGGSADNAALDQNALEQQVTRMCERLLANPVTESYKIAVAPPAEAGA